MEEKEVMLKAYKREIEVLKLTMDVPSYDYNDERRKIFPRYEDVLLKLFNNKRENKEILAIRNYYDSNKITIEVNLTDYMGESDRKETIEHLKTWFSSGLDVSNDMIEEYYCKGHIYTIPEYTNKLAYNNTENYFELDW